MKVQNNISKNECHAIHSLKNDSSIKILPNDKANTTFILDTDIQYKHIINLITTGII